MASNSMIVCEFNLGNKVCRKAHPTKKAAIEWARERVSSGEVASVAVLRYDIGTDWREAMSAVVEGREWFDQRVPLVLVAAKTTKVTR